MQQPKYIIHLIDQGTEMWFWQLSLFSNISSLELDISPTSVSLSQSLMKYWVSKLNQTLIFYPTSSELPKRCIWKLLTKASVWVTRYSQDFCHICIFNNQCTYSWDDTFFQIRHAHEYITYLLQTWMYINNAETPGSIINFYSACVQFVWTFYQAGNRYSLMLKYNFSQN